MTALTSHDRTLLAAAIQSIHPDARNGPAPLADYMRESLPDLDDVTIGRVLLAYGDMVFRVAAVDADATLARAGEQLLVAALDLTALDREEPPQ